MGIESNKYYQNRKEIKKICEANNVDVPTGTSMFERQKGWPSGSHERHVWDAYLIGFSRARRTGKNDPRDKDGDGLVTLADVFV